MLAFAIDRGDRFRKGHAALPCNLLQTVPELVFKADARLVACNDNRALRNQRLHGFSPRGDEIARGPCLTVARIISTCGRNNTVNGKRLRVNSAVSAGIGGEPLRQHEGPWSYPCDPAPGALTI